MDITLYVLQVIVGYMLMLSVMTYNVYVSLAIFLGVFLGYALFGQLLAAKRLKTTELAMMCSKCLLVEREGNLLL